MTLREFFKRARRVQWTVDRDRCVRTKNRLKPTDGNKRIPLCPLAFVLRTWNPVTASARGLTIEQANEIMWRADNGQGWRGRYRLKRALGIA